jgi:hypothetical protein
MSSAGLRGLLVDTLAVNALEQLIELGRTVGADVAPVKGVVLARWLYGSVAERPYRDLDVLVSRASLAPLTAAVKARGWPIRVESVEMGELEFEVGRLVVEVHAEFGRRDLTALTTAAVIGRSRSERETFPFEVLRIDDIDHLLLLVANVTKKAYVYANPHQPGDLERLLSRLEGRWDELVARAREASASTALYSVAAWMANELGSDLFARFLAQRARAPRRALPALVRLNRKLDERRGRRLESASGLAGIALATLTPDDWRLRARGLARVVRRGIQRRLGRDPG